MTIIISATFPPLLFSWIIFTSHLQWTNGILSVTNFDPDRFAVFFNPAVSILDTPGLVTYNEAEILHFINVTYSRFRQVFYELNPGYGLSRTNILVPTVVAKLNKMLPNKTSVMRLSLVAKFGHFSEFSSYSHQHEEDFQAISVLTEVAEHANSIFPGTVEILVQDYTHHKYAIQGLYDDIEDLSKAVNILRNPYKIGLMIPSYTCDEFHNIPSRVRFIILSNLESTSRQFWGKQVDVALEDVSVDFARCKKGIIARHNFMNMNSSLINFALVTSFPIRASGPATFKNLAKFWKGMNNWTINSSSSSMVVLRQAFDTPRNTRAMLESSGWWRLVENSSYTNATQYKFQEKAILDETEEIAEISTLVNKMDTHFDKDKAIIYFDPQVIPAVHLRRYSGGDRIITHFLAKTVSTKFRRAHFGLTYYSTGIPESLIRIPEVVAKLNRNESLENMNFTPLELSVEITVSKVDLTSGIYEFQLARDLMEKANTIFPGTLKKIVLVPYPIGISRQVLDAVSKLSQNKVGVSTYLSHCFGNQFHEIVEPLLSHEIVDLIILNVEVKDKDKLLLVHQIFSWETTMFERCRRRILQTSSNRSIEVILVTGWPENSGNTFALVNFWDKMNSWTGKTNNTVIFRSAFDMAAQGQACQSCGWWVVDPSVSYRAGSPLKFNEKKFVILQSFKKSASAWNTTHLIGPKEIILIIIIAGVSIIAAGISFLCIRKRFSLNMDLEELVQDFQGGIRDPPYQWLGEPYHVSKMEISSNEFEIDETNVLGSGAFGKVCKGKIQREVDGEIETAVKMTKGAHTTVGLRSLLSGIKILCFVGSHENIIQLMGVNTVNIKRGRVYVFLEFCSMGSLDKYLRRWRQQRLEDMKEDNQQKDSCCLNDNLNPERLRVWITQILNGMSFLAAKQVVHADLATRNILLTKNLAVRISDFGLSRRLYDFGIYVKKQGEALPWRWMAPESLRRLEFTEKTGVWSFGVTLWEMCTFGDIPYSGIMCPWQSNLAARLEGGMHLEKPEFADESLYGVMLQCWESDPSARPTFTKLKEVLWPAYLRA